MKTGIKKCFSLWTLSASSLIILFLLPAFASSEETYVFERMWPTLQQPWYFNNPCDMAVDNSGNVYVVDARNHRIQKFNSDGQFIAKWGGQGEADGKFHDPSGIAIDSSGSLYVVDTSNQRIQKFNSDGQFLAKWGNYGNADGEFLDALGIAIDSGDYVYVVDGEKNCVQKFTPDGQFVGKWGSSGSGEGQFNYSTRIEIDGSDHIYVSDTNNHRIQKFTPDGQFVGKWGSEGEGDGQFSYPGGIAFDNNGNVYIADTWNYRIQKFTPDGQFLAKWGEVGSGNGTFNGPEEVESDSAGNLYVVDTSNHRIQKFTPDGQFIAKLASSGGEDGEFAEPSGIAIDSNGYVYVADSWNNRIQKFTSKGQFLDKWGSYGSDDSQFDYPTGIAIDHNGNIYVTDTYNYRIQKFSSNGQFLTEWGSYGSDDSQFDTPQGIAIDSQDYIYVLDTDNHRIQKFSSNGQFIAKWGSEGTEDGQFSYPLDMAIDGSDFVYVSDSYNHRIQKFTSDGQFLTKWGGSGYGSGDGEFAEPDGIAVGNSGYVYVADTYNDRIQKFTSDGQFLTKWGSSGSDPGMFAWVKSLAVDTSGRVFVSEHGNNRIQVFSQTTAPPPDGEPPPDQAQRVNKAIIVAGGGPFPGNNIWDATQMCANYAYRALTYQGYTKQTIYYLTSDTDLDLDGNGLLDDVDADATNSNLQYAITTWAQDAGDLFLYMVNHGGDGTFRMGATELLYATDLDAWLDEIQETIPGPVTLLYDACRSGSFLPLLVPPEGKARVLATSASADQEAIFGSQGTISFSFLFWGHLFNGDSFYDSFFHAMNSINVTYSQDALLEGNWDDTPNQREDQEAARVLKVGNETKSAGDIPYIGSVSPSQTLYGDTSALIYAEEVIDADGISRVWAVISPPDHSQDPNDPVTDLPILELSSVGNNRYEGTYTHFTSSGTYTIAIYATDRGGMISLPKGTTVTSNVSQGDSYEEDDSFSHASVITLNVEAQHHNFHDAGDHDWVTFYGISGEPYEIKTSNLGARCDTVVELYDTDGTTLLEERNWGFEGENELMTWPCPSNGVYYVRVYNYDEAVFGGDTEYDLQVYRPVGPDWKWFIGGMVTNAYSGQPINGASITTSEHGSAISLADGSYLMLHPAGTFTFTLSATAYESITCTGVVIPEGDIDTLDFEMVPIANLYFPHIDTTSPWETEIAIINTSNDQTVSGTLNAYSNTGQLIDAMGITLGPHGRRQLTIADELANHPSIGYIIFEADSGDICGYTKFYVTGQYRVAVPALREVNTTDLYVSHIDSSTEWWTGLSLVNATSEAKTLTLNFDTGQSTTLTLNANEHQAFTIRDLFDGQPQPDIGSAVITNASGVVGLELFGSGTQLSGILLKDDTAATLYYPHVAGGEWWTGVVAYNPSSSSSTLTITPFTEGGTAMAVQTLEIGGKGKYVGTVASLSFPPGTAWFQIEATNPITGFELFGTTDGNQLAGYTAVGINGKEGVFAKLEKAGWTGIAFVNIEGNEASVILTAYDNYGNEVATQGISLGGYAKVVDLPGNLFTQDIGDATYITYSSDRELVGFQLNGSSDGMLLDGLPGR